MKKLLFFILFSLFLIPSQSVSAQEIIHNFDVEIIAQKNGEMRVEEKIKYDYGSLDRHGIYRFIPTLSKVGDLYRSVKIDFDEIKRDGKKEKYEVQVSSDKISIKIGDPDRTVSGVHEYLISYTVKNGIGSNYEDHDEIYWNVTGDEWTLPIASASVNLKTDFDVAPGNTICFTGPAGATDKNCVIEDGNNFKKVITTSFLNPNHGITFVSSFPVNTFPKSVLQKKAPLDPDLKTFLLIVIPLYILLNFVLAPYLLIKYFKKKNKTKYGKAVVNFDIPELKDKKLSPSEVGAIDNMKLDKEDIVASVFDLAIRKYLKIEEIKTKGKILGIGEETDFKLTKLKESTDVNPFEHKVMKQFFSAGKSVSLKSVKLTYTDFTSLESKNFQSLIEKKIYTKNPKNDRSTYLVFGIIALSFGSIILGPVLMWLSFKTTGRTDLGDELDWKIDGLKMFLKATNRYNTWQADNMIFIEKMIPYAVALGLIDQYMKQLKILHPEYSPTWYSGTGTNFYAMYPLLSASASSNVTTTAPSSSSGFSGGSSGGGGGGGGGGSW